MLRPAAAFLGVCGLLRDFREVCSMDRGWQLLKEVQASWVWQGLRQSLRQGEPC